jgi:hypothetical protein
MERRTNEKVKRSLDEQQGQANAQASGGLEATGGDGVGVIRNEVMLEGVAGVKGKLGHHFQHCFSLDQDCTFGFWLWIKKFEEGEKRPGEWPTELSIMHVKAPAFQVGPHLLYGFPQAPGHLFCGLHQIGNNKMVGAFTARPIKEETWHHIAGDEPLDARDLRFMNFTSRSLRYRTTAFRCRDYKCQCCKAETFQIDNHFECTADYTVNPIN